MAGPIRRSQAPQALIVIALLAGGCKTERRAAPSRTPAVVLRQEGAVAELAYAGNGKRLITLSATGEVWEWSLATRTERLITRTRGLFAYSPTRRELVTRTASATTLHSLRDGLAETLTASAADRAAYSTDGRHLALASGPHVQRWALSGLSHVGTTTVARPVRHLQLADDGRYLVVGHSGGLEVYSAESDSRSLSGHVIEVSVVRRHIALLVEPRLLRIFQPDGRLTFERPAEADLQTIALSADGAVLAAAGGRHWVAWAVATGERIDLVAGTCLSTAIAVHPAGRSVAVGCADGSIQVYDLPKAR